MVKAILMSGLNERFRVLNARLLLQDRFYILWG